MLFDQVTDLQMQAGSIIGGATMAAWLATQFFGRRAQRVRLVVAGVYLAGLLGFVVYELI